LGRKRRIKEQDSRQERRQEGKAKAFVRVQALTEGQRRYICTIKDSIITFCTGPAGCGKTMIPVGLGLQALIATNSTTQRIVIMRPVKEACDEKLGYLPGGLGEKMEPWAAPLVDNMKEFLNDAQIKLLFHEERIVIVPLALARGRSLNDSFIILDEAQNCSKKQMLMAVTRIGRNSKMVINGDISQSDDHSMVNGLSDAMSRLRGIDGIGFSELGHEDIVRNPLISAIIERYDVPNPKPANGNGHGNGNGNGNGNHRVAPITADDVILRQV